MFFEKFDISPGSSGKLELNVGKMLTGSETKLTVHYVRGLRKGPFLGVQGCVHGDEAQPVRSFYSLLQSLNPETLSGTLVIVPVANPYAFSNFLRQSPDQHEQTNLWRAFPGKEKGTLTERYAFLLCSVLIDNSDFFIEFHSGGTSGRIQCRVDVDLDFRKKIGQKSKNMAYAFARGGARLVHGVPLSPSSAPGVALKKGKPSISVEIGGSYLPESEENFYSDSMENGFRNLLIHLGMVSGREKRNKILYFDKSNRVEVNPSHGGYLLSRKTQFSDLGKKVRRGELLGEMLDPHTLEIVEELRSPTNGTLFYSRCSGPVEIGNKGFAIASEIQIK
ncbi:MAG: succinylglutamate desuccinylase/aspartoacylase family protein [Nitrospinota bacterium]|nr:succinylglutamate desuccinylase/aspartoacylase family protein [Nitrospinota bacterium]